MASSDLKQRLEEELKQLDYELRTELPKELQRAAALGDLRENGEYESARNRQDYLRLRIAQLRRPDAQPAVLRALPSPRQNVRRRGAARASRRQDRGRGARRSDSGC